MTLKCVDCKHLYDDTRIKFTCDRCEGLLDVVVDLNNISKQDIATKQYGIWKYQKLLPIHDQKDIVTLGEGGTPLIKCEYLDKNLGINNLYLKCDYINPTASFKDRGVSVAISKARQLKVDHVFCASTGNTASSLAAYSVRAGLHAVFVLPEQVPIGKLCQIMLGGSTILGINGDFDDAMNLVKEIGDKNYYIINSINPYRIEGQKTVIFEILEQLNWEVPDYIVIPVGSGGNVVAIYKGLSELLKLNIIERIPKLIGVQASNVDPVVQADKNETEIIKSKKTVNTVAGGINITNPINGLRALKAIRASKGLTVSVSEDEITQMQIDFARIEGIGTEPTGAVPVAGLKKLVKEQKIHKECTVVCILTGSVLKDPDIIIKNNYSLKKVDKNINAVLDLVNDEKSL